MEHIEIHTDGVAHGKKDGAFVVILISKNHIWKRSMKLHVTSSNIASLQGVKFGLLSLAKSIKNPIALHINNKYVRDMLEMDQDGFYRRHPNANKEIIDEIRSLIKDRNDVTIHKIGQYSTECKDLLKQTLGGSPIDYRK